VFYVHRTLKVNTRQSKKFAEDHEGRVKKDREDINRLNRENEELKLKVGPGCQFGSCIYVRMYICIHTYVNIYIYVCITSFGYLRIFMHLDSHKTAFHRWRTWRTSTKAREIWYSVFSLLLTSEFYTRVQVAALELF